MNDKPIQGTLPKGSVVDPNTVGQVAGEARGSVSGPAYVPKAGAGATPGNPLHDQEMIDDRYTAAKQAALAEAAKVSPKQQDEASQKAASDEPQQGHKSAHELPPVGEREYDAFRHSQAAMKADEATHTPEPKDRHPETPRDADAYRDSQLRNAGPFYTAPLPGVPAPREQGVIEVALGRSGLKIEDALRELDEPAKTPEQELKEKRAREYDPTHSGDSTGKPLEANPKKYKVFIRGEQGEHYVSNGGLQMHIKRNVEVIVSARVLEVLKQSQGLDFTFLPA